MTYNEWIQGVADAYGVTTDQVSSSETLTEYLAFCSPTNYVIDEINIVSVRISKNDITP